MLKGSLAGIRQRAEAAKKPFGEYMGPPISEFAKKAVAGFTRRGCSDEKLTADFAVFLKRRGLRVEFEVPLGPVR